MAHDGDGLPEVETAKVETVGAGGAPRRKRHLEEGPSRRWSEFPDLVAPGVSRQGLRALMNLAVASPWVYSAISRIATAVSAVNWRVVRTEGDRDVVERGTDLEKLLRQPNFLQSWEDFVELVVWDLELVGYSPVERTVQDGKTVGLWRLRPDRVEPIPDPVEYLRGWRYVREDGTEVRLARDEVILFKHWSPISDYFGISGVFSIQSSAALELWARAWNKAFFRNGALPEGVFTSEGPIDKDTYNRLRATLRERLGVPDSWRSPLILDNGLKFEATGMTQRDMQFAELLTMVREEILSVLRTPPAMVGVTQAGAGLGTVREQRHTFYFGTVLPLLRKIESTVNRHLSAGGLRMRFDLTDILSLVEDVEAQTRTAEGLVTRGIRTINEVRAEMNLPPVPWGDEWWAPLGLAPVEAPGRPRRPEALSQPEAVEAASPYGDEEEPSDAELKRDRTAAVWKAQLPREVATLRGPWSAALEALKDEVVAAARDALEAWPRERLEKTPEAELLKQEDPEAEAFLGRVGQRVRVRAEAERIAERLRAKVRATASRQGRIAATEVGLRAFSVRADDPVFQEVFRIWLEQVNARRVEHFLSVVEREARAAARERVGARELLRRIEARLGDEAARASQQAAQDDAALFANFGRARAFEEGGVRYKQWLSVRIPTTRWGPPPAWRLEDHGNTYPKGAHEQVVRVTDRFLLRNRRGGFDRAMYPKDPSLSPENFANCLCTVHHLTDEEAQAYLRG